MMQEDAVFAPFGHEQPVLFQAVEGTDQKQQVRAHVAARLIGGKERLPQLVGRHVLADRSETPQAAIDSLNALLNNCTGND